jgi:hypothetical protein
MIRETALADREASAAETCRALHAAPRDLFPIDHGIAATAPVTLARHLSNEDRTRWP